MNEQTLRVPETVLADCAFVVERARDVKIDESQLSRLAEVVESRLLAGIDSIETAFGTTGDLARDVNIVFFETVVNFCFWGDLDGKKWMVERDGELLGGWYSLAACFDRAIAAGIPVDDAQYMTDLSVDQARQLFAGVDGEVEIPLLERRVQNLNEAGEYLLHYFDGSAMKLLESVDFSASRLAEKVALELESFRDGALYEGRWVWMLKRAQILGGDMSQLSVRYPEFRMRDCDKLTAFADYRLPQVFREYGVFEYSEELAHRVDTGVYIESGSSAEVEIRAATIDACERLRHYMPTRSSADIDVGLWLVSQDLRNDPNLKPHHRTVGWFY